MFFRVPLDVFYPALLAASPNTTSAHLLKKVQGQLILELEHKVVAETKRASKGDHLALDFSPSNIAAFEESYHYYRAQVLPQLKTDKQTKQIARSFEQWRRRAGLMKDGRLFGGISRALHTAPVKGKIFGSRIIKAVGLQPVYRSLKSWAN